MDDVLECKNIGGDMVANIQFIDRTPELEDLGQFDRVLFFVTGKIKGGIGNIRRTEVLLNEENDYQDLHPAHRIVGVFEEAGYDTSRFRYSLDKDGITFSKSTQLSAPGTYETVFALIGEDWAEIYVVTIVITVPLRITHSGTNYGTNHTHGQTATLDLTAANAPQRIRVYGNRPWTLEGVESDKINVSPLLGEGNDYYYDTITLNPVGTITGPKQTTFRILAETRWVDVVVNLRPPLTFNFVNPREGEAGAPEGTDPVYIYL